MSVIGTSVNYIPTSDLSTYFPTMDLSLYNDTTLSGLVTRASSVADNFLGYTLPYETITSEKQEGIVDADGNLTIFTAKFPIDTVSAITVSKGTVQLKLTLLDTAQNLNRYDIIPSWQQNEIVYPNNQLSLTGAIRITSFYQLRQTRFYTTTTYNAGYQTIPSDVKQAIALLVIDMVAASNYNPMGAQHVSQGGVSYSFGAGGSEREAEAFELLARYRRTSGF